MEQLAPLAPCLALSLNSSIRIEVAADRGAGASDKAIERTFAWIGRNRRISRDYEWLIETDEMLLYASTSRVVLRRLAK